MGKNKIQIQAKSGFLFKQMGQSSDIGRDRIGVGGGRIVDVRKKNQLLEVDVYGEEKESNH